MSQYEDTEWTDILKKHGIIKEEPKVDTKDEETPQISTFEKKLSEIQTEDDLLELDESDECILREYRLRRIAELEAQSMTPKFGDVREITACDYVQQVNNAGQHIPVVLLLYQSGIPECTVMLRILNELAVKYPTTKFLKSIASLCVANFPDSRLPTIFLYQNGILKKQLIGSQTFGGKDNINIKTVEWLLSQNGFISCLDKESQEIDKKSNKFYEQY
ncbi:phosducin-like protein 3 [Oppia nitens]|uniref:phosducin-like protein 3 n=1 Tax=Oppia nitens TaxID=1686743 RepID=UPI0023DC6D78|nr:phosducin-like protein 3 [Oppia nitens]